MELCKIHSQVVGEFLVEHKIHIFKTESFYLMGISQTQANLSYTPSHN